MISSLLYYCCCCFIEIHLYIYIYILVLNIIIIVIIVAFVLCRVGHFYLYLSNISVILSCFLFKAGVL